MGKCTQQCDEKQGNNSAQTLSTKKKWSSLGVRREATKEEGSKEDRQGANVKKKIG